MDYDLSDFLTATFIEARRQQLLEREQSIHARLATEDMPEAQRTNLIRVVLPNIMAALARIHVHAYGYCSDCEEPILQTRLELRPESPRCVHCQQTLDRQNPTDLPREQLLWRR
ncbi:MAG: DksA-type zinc finger protein [Parcubacteria group bacterium GW2011_GWC2_39_14]|nr:MAG: DksA-type zinc finger protein [Parcubacteria group bacterium GW2011_GWC2_39_14]KKR55024.1 MAG: DksA-type zinc finger protein [Parcubacteria group bacterium GW2011_GWA2_40_23]